MVKLTNVIKRGGIYHFRMGIPKDLQGHYGKKEHTESLKTADELEARKKSEPLTAKYKAEHRKLRAVMKKEPISTIPKVAGAKKNAFDLSAVEYELSQLSDDLMGMENDALNTLYHRLGNVRHSLKFAIDKGLTEEWLSRADLRPALGQTLLELCQEQAGVKDLSDDVLRRKTARFVIPKLQEMLELVEDKIPPLLGKTVSPRTEPHLNPDGQWLDMPVSKPDPLSPTAKPTNDPAPKAVLYSKVADDCAQASTKNPKDKKSSRSMCNLLIEWHGDRPITEYTAQMLIPFTDDCLMKIPSGRNKLELWRDLPIKKCISECSQEDLMLPKTMLNYASSINAVFRYAVEEDLISKNPARKMKARLPEIEDKDRSYSPDEVKTMLSLLEYDEKRPSRYWITLIGLFTGARLNEIAQLRVSDVLMDDSVDCISINKKDAKKTFKKVKNKHSIRMIPIHPMLIDIGLLKYTDSVRSTKGGDALLFPELKHNKYSGYYRKFSRWFNGKEMKEKFLSDDNTSHNGFHSIRNTFVKQAQNEAEMEDRAIMQMTGHKAKGVTDVHLGYSGALKPMRLLKEIVKLDYGLSVPDNPFMKP